MPWKWKVTGNNASLCDMFSNRTTCKLILLRLKIRFQIEIKERTCRIQNLGRQKIRHNLMALNLSGTILALNDYYFIYDRKLILTLDCVFKSATCSCFLLRPPREVRQCFILAFVNNNKITEKPLFFPGKCHSAFFAI